MQTKYENALLDGSQQTITQSNAMMNRPILVVDMDGRVRYANQHATILFGYHIGEGENQYLDRITNDPKVIERLRELIRTLESGEMSAQEVAIRDVNGKQMNINFSIFSLLSRDETLICMVAQPNITSVETLLSTANNILREVDTLLGSEVNYEAMLKKVVDFITPQLADLCTIHLIQPDGSLDQMALASSNRQIDKSILRWIEEDLPNDETDGLVAVMHECEPRLITQVNPVRRAAKAGIKSYMILPLITHQLIKGAITLISIDPTRIFDQSSLALAKNIAINISIYLEKNRLHKESLQLRDELEQRVINRTKELQEAISQLKQSEHMIQTLFRISNKLNATLDVDQILDELALEAIKIVNGESGFAGLRIPEGMQVKKYFENDHAIAFEHTWAIGEGIPGWVLKYKVPYGTSDAKNDPLILRELMINDNVRSVICTPILDSVGDVIGYFDIRNKIGAEGFSISDQEMLLTLAPVASIAIQNALAYQRRLENVAELKETSRQLEELAARLESAREEERMRISRELHDQLGQSLTALKFDLTSLTNQVKNLDDNLVQKSKDILTQLNTMIKAVRRISTELRPGMLDDLGLIASIEWLASDFEKRTGIECKINAPNKDVVLNREQSLALYRIFQEALTNVTRYAEAKHIKVSITSDGKWLELVFEDDGRGIRHEEITGGKSLGLLGMRERVKHIGGSFTINGYPDRGTIIKVKIPLQLNDTTRA